jgi:RecA/RadA recombinase
MSKLLDKILKASSVKNTSILSESILFTDRDVITTEIPIINVAYSGELNGGIPAGVNLWAGPSKSYKTLGTLMCVKAYLNKYEDGVCILYDSEGGVTPDYLKNIGIDPARVVHIPIEHIEMLKFDMVKQLKELDRDDKVIMVIDSIGNTASLKELEDAQNEKTVADMQRAKSIKALFRMITPSLVAKDIPCMVVAHTYAEMTLYPRQIISGGTGLIYSANSAFILSKSQEKDGDEIVGWNFTINIEKSRFVKEKSKLIFTVKYDGGIDKYSGILDLAMEFGFVVKPKNGWYQLVDMDTGEMVGKMYRAAETGCDEFLGKVLTHPKFAQEVKKKYSLAAPKPVTIEDSDE